MQSIKLCVIQRIKVQSDLIRKYEEKYFIRDENIFPIKTFLGEWNNMYSPEASINDFFRRCENYFGFRPYIVAMDIVDGHWYSPSSLKADRFAGIDNMIYIPSNPAMIEQFLTNFKDMDTFDVYTPLLSMYRSNRYQLVRENTL